MGKTTLLQMIGGLERRFDGRITIDSKLVTKPSRDVQIVFQDYRLLPWKTVHGNIEFAGRRQDPQADGKLIEKWLKIVKVEDKKDVWPKTLSGGEAGRVVLARAFVSSPGLLLLDEPFSNLDMVAKFKLQDEFQEYLRIQKTTAILVSHNIEDVVFMSDTIHVLSDRRMKVDRTFTVDASRPRRHGDPLLSNVHEEIVAHLEASTRGESGHG